MGGVGEVGVVIEVVGDVVCDIGVLFDVWMDGGVL